MKSTPLRAFTGSFQHYVADIAVQICYRSMEDVHEEV